MKDTIKYKDVVMEVEYDYTPEEPMVMYYKDGSGHPGSPAYVEVHEIKIGGQDVYHLLEDEAELIEEYILNSNQDTEDY